LVQWNGPSVLVISTLLCTSWPCQVFEKFCIMDILNGLNVWWDISLQWDSHRSESWLRSLITWNWTTRNMIGPKLYMVISEKRYWKAYQIVKVTLSFSLTTMMHRPLC
jgi:hypothetical protein